MNNNSWQYPFVNIFKHFDIDSAKKCCKQGDVTRLIDRELKCIVYRIRGLIPSNNYIQFPAQSNHPPLGLTGRLFYILFRPMFDKHFYIHLDLFTRERTCLRLSISNAYRELKTTHTSIQFPYMTTGTDIHWSVLCLDLEMILLTYLTNAHYFMLQSFQFSGNLFIKNCFTSSFLYEPGVDNDTARRTGLIRAGIRSLPRELSYPLEKGEFWHDRYDFIMFPNGSPLTNKNPHEPFDKVGNVRVPTPRKLNDSEQENDGSGDEEILPITAQTTLVNGQMSRSMTDFAQVTQRSASNKDPQSHWRTYPNATEHFPSLPIMSEPSSPDDNGVHLFVHPKSLSSSNSTDDEPAPSVIASLSARVLLPDPILRLRTVIGFSSTAQNLLWAPDDNYILYASNALLVQMHIDTHQQWFFIGHTDKITSIVFHRHSNTIATIQTGNHAVVRLWKFETRRSLCSARVPNTCDLHALDYGPRNTLNPSSLMLAVAGLTVDRTKTVVSVYNVSNANLSSLELMARAVTPVSITHLCFLSSSMTSFISIGSSNLQFWTVGDGNELKSRQENIDDLQYTDLQLEYLSHHQWNDSTVYLATKTGRIIQFMDLERRIYNQYDLNYRMSKFDASSSNITVFACTDHFRVTGSSDGYLRIWSMDFSQLYIKAKYDQAIDGLKVSHDQTRVLVSTQAGLLGIFNLIKKTHVDLLRTHTKTVTDIDYDEDRNQLISVSQDRTIRLWSCQNQELVMEYGSDRDVPLMITYTPNRKGFACGFQSGTIKLFDIKTSNLLHEFKHHTSKITGLLYSAYGAYLISSDSDRNLCLSDTKRNYDLQRIITDALAPIDSSSSPLSLSLDGKYLVYIGPTVSTITVLEINSLSQTLRIDLNQFPSVVPEPIALMARFASTRQIFVATKDLKLLKFDAFVGKFLSSVDQVHQKSIDTLALSSDHQYMVTAGDQMLKFWDASMKLDRNFQIFLGHSEPIRKVFFTADNMRLISVGDSICVWDVLAWSNLSSAPPDNAQCLTAPHAVLSQILDGLPVRPKIEELESMEPICTTHDLASRDQIHQKLLSRRASPAIRRHFIPRYPQSSLAKKRYLPADGQAMLQLQSIFSYNGNGRENLLWHPSTGLFVYTVGCNVIIEELTTHQQIFLSGHSEEVSTLALSTDGHTLISAQSSIAAKKDEFQLKLIVWDLSTRRQKHSFYENVQAIQAMGYSKNDSFLLTIGNYQKPTLSLWSTDNYRKLCTWQDHSSTWSYLNCFAWNPRSSHEFCLGGSQGLLHFCTIQDDANIYLRVLRGQIPSLYNPNNKKVCDITACVYLPSMMNLILCATDNGSITCWNTRLALCLHHWRADSNEICWMRVNNHRLLTGSSTGCLKLWNIEPLLNTLEQVTPHQLNHETMLEDELEVNDSIISGSFDDQFGMGLVGTADGTIWYICWSPDRSKTALITSHRDCITDLICIDDMHIATSSSDGTIRIFRLEDRSELLRIHAERSKPLCLALWNTSSRVISLVAGCDDGLLRLFNRFNGQMTVKVQAHSTSITAVHIPTNSSISLSGASDGSIAIAHLVQGVVLNVLTEHQGCGPICMFDSKESRWLATSQNGQVSLWKSNRSFESSQLIGWISVSSISDDPKRWHSLPPTLAHFLDQHILICTDQGLQVYDYESKKTLRRIASHQMCTCLDLTEENRFLVFGTANRLIEMKDYTQETFQDFLGHTDRVSRLRFNPSKDLLISTSANEILVWRRSSE